MSRVRDALAVIGVATVAIGLLFIVQPAYAAVLTVPRAALVILGLIAFVEGLRSIQTRRRTEIDGADLPEPESGIELSRPGDDFDGLVARWSTWQDHRRIGSADRRVQDRLRDAAVRAIVNRDSVPREEARERVEVGTWTDDPVAAAFLGGSDAPAPPFSIQLRGLVRAGSTSRFYVDRTTAAIAAVWEER